MAKEKSIKYKVNDCVIVLKRPDYNGNMDCVAFGKDVEVELSEAEYKGISDKVTLLTSIGEPV